MNLYIHFFFKDAFVGRFFPDLLQIPELILEAILSNGIKNLHFGFEEGAENIGKFGPQFADLFFEAFLVSSSGSPSPDHQPDIGQVEP